MSVGTSAAAKPARSTTIASTSATRENVMSAAILAIASGASRAFRSGEAETLLQRTHAVARDDELAPDLAAQAHDEMAAAFGVQLAHPGQVQQRTPVNPHELRGIELALELDDRRIQHVLGGRRRRVRP